MADQQANAQQGWREFWNRYFGGQPDPVPANARAFVPDRPHDVLIQGLEAIRLTNEFIEEVAEFDLQAAKDFLDAKFYGQPMSERYRAQCATALGQELDRQNVRNMTRRAKLIPRAVEGHITGRLRDEPRWNRESIEKVNRFNQGVNGDIQTRNPYFYWQWDRTTIASNLNSDRPWDDERSFRLSHLVAPMAVVAGTAILAGAVGLAARAAWKWFTSPPSMPDMTCFITPSTNSLLQPRTSIDMLQEAPQTTRQIVSAVSIGISKSLSVIQESLQESNTLTRSMIQHVEELTRQQQMGLMQGVRLWIVSHLSPK